jgi:hypothetical protein
MKAAAEHYLKEVCAAVFSIKGLKL